MTQLSSDNEKQHKTIFIKKSEKCTFDTNTIN